MLTRQSIAFAVLVICGCSNTESPSDATPQLPIGGTEVSAKTTPTHDAEHVAFQFITNIRDDRTAILNIAADAELSAAERDVAFRALKRFIKSQEWDLWFTSIDVYEGKEDSVDCYLRGDDGGLLILLLGYHYDVKEWRIGAYEIPGRTFARPENETYADYVARSVAESKKDAKPYTDRIRDDGRYHFVR